MLNLLHKYLYLTNAIDIQNVNVSTAGNVRGTVFMSDMNAQIEPLLTHLIYVHHDIMQW